MAAYARSRKKTSTRIRKANFSHAERTALFEGVCKWKDIISAKENAREKAEAFEEITSRVNIVSSVVRTVKDVKKKWIEFRGSAFRLKQELAADETDEAVPAYAKRKESAKRLPEVKLVLDILSDKITPLAVRECMDELREVRPVETPRCTLVSLQASSIKDEQDAGSNSGAHDSAALIQDTATGSCVNSHIVQTANFGDITFSPSFDCERVHNGTSASQGELGLSTPKMEVESDADYKMTKADDQHPANRRSKSKRGRKSNFSDKEMSLLMDGLEVHRDALGRRAVNEHMMQQKLRAWRIVTEYVNKNTDQNVRRTAKELRKKMAEMNLRTRNHTRSVIEQSGKNAPPAPWFHDRMMKLETLRPLYKDKPDRVEPKRLFYKKNRMKRVGAADSISRDLDHPTNRGESLEVEVADHEADTVRQKMIQYHLSRVAESVSSIVKCILLL